MFTTHLHDPNDLRYSFYVVWFDALASLNREYVLMYYSVDKTVEMTDRKSKKQFLKRCQYPDIKLENLFEGATVVVLGRQLKIVAYADLATKEALTKAKEHSFLLIRPEAYLHAGKIFETLFKNECVIAKLKTIVLNPSEAEQLFKCDAFTPSSTSSDSPSSASPLNSTSPIFNEYCDTACDGMCFAVEIVGPQCVALLQDLVGNPVFSTARSTQPQSMVAKYGVSSKENGVYCSPTLEKAMLDSKLIFDKPRMPTAELSHCSVAVVLPHAISEGCLGPIITEIFAVGFRLSAVELFQLTKSNAAEFFEVYETVIPEYPHIVDEACNGPCVAMEIVDPRDMDKLRAGEPSDGEVVTRFRDFVGPADPVVAKTLRPNSLRAKFGSSRLRNAVHCTDLPEDGILESEYFWSILQQ